MRVYQFAESAKALTNRIYKDVQQTETKVREMLSRYQSLTRELAVENKKESGTLVTRRLDNVVPDNVIFESEYMMSVFVVPNEQKRAFLKSYEKVCEMVIPKSAWLVSWARTSSSTASSSSASWSTSSRTAAASPTSL